MVWMRKTDTIKNKFSLDVNHIACLIWSMHSAIQKCVTWVRLVISDAYKM